ncbi:POTRA domain-containing protein [Actinobacillus seminis]|uniref:POTRA domain-containing protein n=1 Tax=Actinobacillus seminis TaxID=722 RepID=UPI003B92E3B7
MYKISLLDYSTDNNFSLSQFSLELNKSIKDLKIKLPLCISTDGINVLVKTIQNKIIEKGYVTTRVVVPEKILPMVNLI